MRGGIGAFHYNISLRHFTATFCADILRRHFTIAFRAGISRWRSAPAIWLDRGYWLLGLELVLVQKMSWFRK